METNRKLDEERGRAVSTLWWTVFTRGDMAVPETTGDEVEQMRAMLRDWQESQTEVENLRGRRERWEADRQNFWREGETARKERDAARAELVKVQAAGISAADRASKEFRVASAVAGELYEG